MTRPPKAPGEHKKKNRQKQWIWIATAIFVLCALIFIIYWFAWGQFHESTDDAYVNGNMITVTAQEGGIVTAIYADNTQIVEEGQPILELDRHDYQIVLDRAVADLGDAVRKVNQLFLHVPELEARRDRSKSDLLRASWDYNHRQALVKDGSVSREEFEHSETAFLGAIADLRSVDKQLESARAQVENTTVSSHPMVEIAKANVRKAYLGLHRCTVLAPARGIISQRKAQVGEWVNGSDPLMALIPIDQMWVDANYREVELKNLRIGQPVELIADMYGKSVKYRGEIVGLNGGTGSVFSILPPQNATGNWIKIIQRIPVKISLDQKQVRKFPLVLGLTMTVTTNTRDRDGLRLPLTNRDCKPIYQTIVYENELDGAKELIESTIAENTIIHE